MERLSKSEKQLMDFLWDSKEPLTCAQIIEKNSEKKWRDSYVHNMVTSLMKKGLIEVESVELICKIYARKLVPTMTKEQYIIETLIDENILTKEKMPDLFCALVDKTIDMQTLENFRKIITKRKKELLK